jgi:hypothetical protein
VVRIATLLLIVLYFVASRDALRNYYSRTSALLDIPQPTKDRNDDERLSSRPNSGQAAADGR